MRRAVRDSGYELTLDSLPKSVGPLTFVFCGSGNVSIGAQEIIKDLPHEYVTPDQLKHVAEQGDLDKVYCCVVIMQHHLVHKETGQFDEADYYAHPGQYISNFAKDIAPYASVIINGIYWVEPMPRLILTKDLKNLLKPAQPALPSAPGCPTLPHRLLAISDISCDIGGSIEFATECTTMDHPFIHYDHDAEDNHYDFEGKGILICNIGNMPTQLPRDSPEYFGNQLYPYIDDIAKIDPTKNFESQELDSVVKDAIITANGKLTPNYEYITELRKQGH